MKTEQKLYWWQGQILKTIQECTKKGQKLMILELPRRSMRPRPEGETVSDVGRKSD